VNSLCRLIILTFILFLFEYNKSIKCIEFLWIYIIGYLAMLFGNELSRDHLNHLINFAFFYFPVAVKTINELIIIYLSMRGSILDTARRNGIQYWLYFRTVLMLLDIGCLSAGTYWLKEFYLDCPIYEPKEIVLSK
jgi:sn1-specific diacylglycerol lipase